jgi:hypothetical protein
MSGATSSTSVTVPRPLGTAGASSSTLVTDLPLTFGGDRGFPAAAMATAAATPSMHGLNIQSVINFKLDPARGNYSKWRHLMLVLMRRYDILEHVEVESNPLHEDAIWRNDDLTLVLWFYATISDELFDLSPF